KALEIHDLLGIDPFGSRSIEASFAILEKGTEITYPVPYYRWILKKGRDIGRFMSLSRVKEITTVDVMDAYPDPSTGGINTPWILVPEGTKPALVKGKVMNPYDVRHGVVNDLNSVFFVQILKEQDGKLLVKNHEVGKKKVPSKKMHIERDLIYPVIKPRHVKKWEIKGHYYMVIPHKKHGINNELELKENFPATLQYLNFFKKHLENRASRWFKGGNKPFYSLFGIGPYAFKPCKVVWSSIGYAHSFAVAPPVKDDFIGTKVIIPDNTIGYIPLDTLEEAHYICGILNSGLIEKHFASISTKSKWGISINMVKRLPIPKFEKNNEMHIKISNFSRKAHDLKKDGNDVTNLEEILDEIVPKVIFL
ncbi:MAG: hypothetical protein ACFFCS_05145, partial [Candidatus Hodarchaeota archaeon]